MRRTSPEPEFYTRYGVKVFNWWKLHLSLGQVQFCEICETELDSMYPPHLCDSCYEEHFCECGTRLEDTYGQPGDGFCISCR